jgi:hypothetical protein
MANFVQNSYDVAPAAGLPGQHARFKPGQYLATLIALAAMTPGLVAFNGRAVGGAAGEGGHMTAPAASATGILATGGASSASSQTLSGATLNGTYGNGAELMPPRNVTLVLSSSADWDATTATVTGTDENGAALTESIAIPNGGNATVLGASAFRTVTSIVIPAQSGTGGTFTVGIGSVFGSVDHLVEGLVARDITRSAVAFAAGELVPVMRNADAFVTSESAVKEGDPVFVRVRAPSGETIGAVRATPVAGETVRLKNARFTSTNSAGLSRIDLNLPAG